MLVSAPPLNDTYSDVQTGIQPEMLCISYLSALFYRVEDNGLDKVSQRKVIWGGVSFLTHITGKEWSWGYAI